MDSFQTEISVLRIFTRELSTEKGRKPKNTIGTAFIIIIIIIMKQ